MKIMIDMVLISLLERDANVFIVIPHQSSPRRRTSLASRFATPASNRRFWPRQATQDYVTIAFDTGGALASPGDDDDVDASAIWSVVVTTGSKQPNHNKGSVLLAVACTATKHRQLPGFVVRSRETSQWLMQEAALHLCQGPAWICTSAFSFGIRRASRNSEMRMATGRGSVQIM